MARRKRGAPVTGWVLVDKPTGVTSTAVTNKIRWLLGAQKAGHAGTLDPDATGLLVVALGEATKVLSHITDALKAYDFTVTWGASTNTDDASGTVLERRDSRPSAEQIRAVLPQFIGKIEQVPPTFSAVHVAGKRAYDLARQGATPDLASRPLFVETLELTNAGTDAADFHLVCGKGGYVRAISRDMGEKLECLGHTLRLRRVWSGPFHIRDALVWHDDITSDEVRDALKPLAFGLADLRECQIDAVFEGRLKNGNKAPVQRTDAGPGDVAWASIDGTPIALGTYLSGDFQPSRVFIEPRDG